MPHPHREEYWTLLCPCFTGTCCLGGRGTCLYEDVRDVDFQIFETIPHKSAFQTNHPISKWFQWCFSDVPCDNDVENCICFLFFFFLLSWGDCYWTAELGTRESLRKQAGGVCRRVSSESARNGWNHHIGIAVPQGNYLLTRFFLVYFHSQVCDWNVFPCVVFELWSRQAFGVNAVYVAWHIGSLKNKNHGRRPNFSRAKRLYQ